MTRVILAGLFLLLLLMPWPPEGAVHQAEPECYLCYVPGVYWALNAKKGLGTHHPELCNAGQVGASWAYNWHSQLPDCPGVEMVPMVYNAHHLEGLRLGQYRMMGNSEYILGFNEPDNHFQANLTPEEAAGLWHTLEAEYPDRRLVSPAVVFHTDWLVRFRAAYIARYGTPPRLDGLAVHCYRNVVDACRETVEAVIGYARAWGVSSVWVTEFMFWGEGAEAKAVAFIAWMNAEPMIARYAWFPGTLTGEERWLEGLGNNVRERYMDGQLVRYDGTLTRWGQLYRMQ